MIVTDLRQLQVRIDYKPLDKHSKAIELKCGCLVSWDDLSELLISRYVRVGFNPARDIVFVRVTHLRCGTWWTNEFKEFKEKK